jgi:outer membrane protein OmpA-like peptidoglycan-associated protein
MEFIKFNLRFKKSVGFFKCLTPIVVCLGLMPSLSAQSADLMLVTDDSVKRVFYGQKDFAEYDLFTGKMNYIEDATSEGYKPTATQVISGSINRAIYDYPNQKSAVEIYQKTLSELHKQKYGIIYKCSGEACGGVDGWRLYLSKKVGGKERFQHYVVASKKQRTQSLYYVFYINDLSGQPRALVDNIVIPRLLSARGSGDGSQNVPVASIYFESNSSALDNREEQLSRLKEFIAARGSLCPLRIVGYTNSIGSERDNRKLADTRVNAVVSYLRDTLNLSTPSCLISEPRGVEPVEKSLGFAASRRVDVIANN